jgi:hypothetical protein
MSNEQFPPRPDDDTIALIDRLLKSARRQLVQSGDVAPVFLVLHGEGGAEAIAGQFENPREKHQVAMMVRGLVNALDAHTVISVMECWTLPRTMTPDEIDALRDQYTQIADMPQRIEAITVMIEQRDGRKWAAQAYIERKGRAVRLGEPVYNDMTGAEVAGRFGGWFAPERPTTDFKGGR